MAQPVWRNLGFGAEEDFSSTGKALYVPETPELSGAGRGNTRRISDMQNNGIAILLSQGGLGQTDLPSMAH